MMMKGIALGVLVAGAMLIGSANGVAPHSDEFFSEYVKDRSLTGLEVSDGLVTVEFGSWVSVVVSTASGDQTVPVPLGYVAVTSNGRQWTDQVVLAHGGVVVIARAAMVLGGMR